MDPAPAVPVELPAPPSTPPFQAHDPLEGLSGWLILVGIGLVFSPIRLVRTILAVNLPFLFDAKYQTYLANHRLSAALGASELITNTILLFALLLLNYLFFARKKDFPNFLIAFYLAQVIFLSFDHFSVRALHPTADLTKGAVQLASIFLAACIWIPYLLRSRRVKATFVR
jgi:hypothetical protein